MTRCPDCKRRFSKEAYALYLRRKAVKYSLSHNTPCEHLPPLHDEGDDVPKAERKRLRSAEFRMGQL